MTKHRLAAQLGLAALIAGALVPLTSSAAGASPGCTDETQPKDPILGLPTGDGCDDDTPPETTLSASSTPNAARRCSRCPRT